MSLRHVISILLLGSAAQAADQDAKWDVSSPPGERREIRLDLRTGTWISLDVSPDGQRIVFDLLGDLYEQAIQVEHT